MRELLYMKIDQNILVKKPLVTLGDIASLTSFDKNIVDRVKKLPVYEFQKEKEIVVFSVLKIIRDIQRTSPNVQVVNLGESDFLIEYLPVSEKKWIGIIKVLLLSALIFFGAAFAIMTFHNDVGVPQVFSKIHVYITGKSAVGFGVLEIFYSIGLAAGILVFFNHVGRKKVTHDPTPMQVQMRKYEKDVDNTFIENCSRKGTNKDVE